MMKEVLLLAHENENDERELMPDENIDTLKDACQNLNLTVIKTYTQADDLHYDIEHNIVANLPVILWGDACDYPGLKQFNLDCYSHIDILPHLEMIGA